MFKRQLATDFNRRLEENLSATFATALRFQFFSSREPVANRLQSRCKHVFRERTKGRWLKHCSDERPDNIDSYEQETAVMFISIKIKKGLKSTQLCHRTTFI